MNLQEQINLATPGATIIIPDGERCIGNFVIDKPLTIIGGPGSVIVAPAAHSETDWANPAIEIPPMTGPVVLRKLSITVADNVKNFWDLIRYGGADAASGQTSIDKVPQGLWIDECDIFGRADVGSQRGISANGANFKITRSKVREIHGRGFDTQAICSWNGPGPFYIEDCYLEAAGENVMFGGSPPIIPDLIHSDITFKRNVCFKPLSWRGVWTVKNLFELKNSRRVIVDGNIFDGNWTDAQAGRAIAFTPRPSDSGSWAVVEDVEFTNNIVRNVGSGIILLGADQPPAPTETRLRRVRIANNIFDIDGPRFDSNGAFATVINKTEDVTIEHNTVIQTNQMLVSDYAPNTGFIYRNNINRHNEYGIFGSGVGIGNAAIAFFFPGSIVAGNLIAKEINAPSNVEQIYPGGNYFPATLAEVIDADYRVREAWKGKGTDGKDPGVDIDALKAAQAGTGIPTPPPTPPPVPTPPPTPPAESPNNTRVPPGTQIVDSTGAVWTRATNGAILRNGTNTGGTGPQILYCNHIVYALGTDSQWWRWTGTFWTPVGAVDPCAVPTPPVEPPPVEPPVTKPCSITAPTSVTIPRNSSGVIAVQLNDLTGPVVVNVIGSDGQVTVTPLTWNAEPTSIVKQFQVRTKNKRQMREIKFQSGCGVAVVKVNVV